MTKTRVWSCRGSRARCRGGGAQRFISAQLEKQTAHTSLRRKQNFTGKCGHTPAWNANSRLEFSRYDFILGPHSIHMVRGRKHPSASSSGSFQTRPQRSFSIQFRRRVRLHYLQKECWTLRPAIVRNVICLNAPWNSSFQERDVRKMGKEGYNGVICPWGKYSGGVHKIE